MTSKIPVETVTKGQRNYLKTLISIWLWKYHRTQLLKVSISEFLPKIPGDKNKILNKDQLLLFTKQTLLWYLLLAYHY